jgi:signal transduction histidine kinase
VRLRRPSGATLVTGVLLVLVPALAVLQYRWVGQVSAAERDRMQRNLRIAAAQFREAFDGEIIRASLNLQAGPGTARDGASERYSERYDTWLETATHPRVVANVFLVDEDDGGLRLRRWNADSHTFDPTRWPAVLELERAQFERDLRLFTSGRPPERRSPSRGEESLVVSPIRNGPPPPGVAPGTARSAPVFGFTVLQLDMDYVRDEMLPELAVRHFTHADGDNYRVAVTAAGGRLLYRSDPEAPVDAALADATMPLLGRPDPRFVFGRPGSRPDNRDDRGGPGPPRPRGAGRDAATDFDRPPRVDETGRWLLLVQHQSGSLETAVGVVRRRNLGISFGILLLLSVSIGLLTATARRAQRLAQQQMEFVAGVSHELRTPVAVIRSAAENLAQGVVGGDRVKRYGETIGGEARRLGEMVERVLQYAGIDSGLGLGSRVALSPQEIVEAALASVMSRVSDGAIAVQREIAADLPTVSGDGPALRSAVENLIANAIKYGGADRFVGLKVDLARERGRFEVRITVSDHGAGIPAAELPHIFDPFYRGADATARQVHGSGLGLSLVKRIVTAHGGRVWVTTRAGAGTAFTIALPCAQPDTRPGRLADAVHPAHS